MPDQRIEHAVSGPAVDDRDRERNILNLVLDDPWPWTVDEIVLELHNRIEAEDAISRLADVGLLHRLNDGFVFPTRAARRADELGLGDA